MNNIQISDHFRRNYEDYYETGDSKWRWLGALDKADNIISLCSTLPHFSVLEIGAGEGSILKRLSELRFGEELYALEISATGVETILKKQITRLTECLLFDGYCIPYNNQKFDLAILSHVIEHVEFPRKLLYEAARIAKYIFVEVPLEDTMRLERDFVFDKVGHINSYSTKTIRRLIQTCNLEVLNQIVTNPSKATYIYQNGKKGLIKYCIKKYLLKVFPSLATSIFTYHSALVIDSLKRVRKLSE
jgi:ubiquinone/menaquinone biosynthesis C-methylase UbiE